MERDPDLIEGDPEEFWRKLEEEIKSWPECPPEPNVEAPPPFI
jgi:hypothetical protein